MKIITTAIAAVALLGSLSLANAQEMRETRTKVVVHKTMHHGPMTKKVIIRQDRGMHRGWRHADRHADRRGAVVRKKVIITH